MGLDFSHCNARWAYSGFMRFRRNLAAEIHIDLDKMNGFIDDGSEGISWDTVTDPLKLLLKHSDCDGELTPVECEIIAPRLRQMISRWKDDYEKQYDYRMAVELANGMEHAAEMGENLDFC